MAASRDSRQRGEGRGRRKQGNTTLGGMLYRCMEQEGWWSKCGSLMKLGTLERTTGKLPGNTYSVHDMFNFISSLAMGPAEPEERLKVKVRYEV